MAIQFRAASTLAYVTGSAETITKPTGTIDGDYMIMTVSDNNTSHTRLQPSGDWLEIPFANLTGATSVHLWWRKAASEPASYTLTSPSSILGYVSIVTLYSDTGDDIDVEALTSQTNSSSTNRTFPSVTFTSSAGMLFCAGTLSINFSSTPPGGMTERVDAGQTGIRQYVMTKTISSSGATGTKVATGSAAASSCVSLALIEGTPTHLYPRYRDREIIFPASNSGDLSATIPATAEEGDMLLWHLSMTNSGRTFTTPTGWTLHHDIVVNGGILVYTKGCEAGDPGATVHLTFTGGSTTLASTITAIKSPRGRTLAVDVSGEVDNSGTAASTATYPTVTTSQPYTLLLCLTGMQDATSFSVSNSNDHLWRQYSVGGTGCRVEMYHLFQAAAGSTGSLSVPWSSGTHESTTVILAIYEEEPPAPASRVYPSEGYYAVVFDGHDVTPYVRVGDLLGVTEQLDATSLADVAPVEEAGSTTWRVTIEGLLEKQIDDWLGVKALGQGDDSSFDNLTITIGETGNATTYTWTGDADVGAFVENYKIGPNAEFGAIPFRAELGASGAPARGTA